MTLPGSFSLRRVSALTVVLVLAALATSCTMASIIEFSNRPAVGYDASATKVLRVAIIDETGGNDWTPAIQAATQAYGSATPHLAFQDHAEGANIVIHIRRYNDAQPLVIRGYTFPRGVGGYAAVYDADGFACNFPPSPLPLGCSGEIAESDLYLNDVIPAGADIETRRGRLILHEMGHAMGLARHAPDLGIAELAARYGWD